MLVVTKTNTMHETYDMTVVYVTGHLNFCFVVASAAYIKVNNATVKT